MWLAMALALSQILIPLRPLCYQAVAAARFGPAGGGGLPSSAAQPEWGLAGNSFSWRMMTRSVQFLHCGVTVTVHPAPAADRSTDSRKTGRGGGDEAAGARPAVQQQHRLELPELSRHIGGSEIRVVEMCADPEQLRQLAADLGCPAHPYLEELLIFICAQALYVFDCKLRCLHFSLVRVHRES